MKIAPGLPGSIRNVLERDLSRFPSPWLQLLEDSGVRVAVLEDGDTLADSPALADKGVTDLAREWKKLSAMPGEPEAAHAWLLENHSPFRLAYQPYVPLNAEQIAEQRHVPEKHKAHWVELFQALNPYPQEVVVLPPVPTDYGYQPDSAYQSARETSAEFVASSLGLNRPAERLVLLHSRFLPDNAPEIGGYRVAVHELGHALDHVLENLPDSTGFGHLHKQKVEGLFAQAHRHSQTSAAHPQESVTPSFTSDRADDNAREFFAEGVEAYLTEPSAGPDFRPDNHRQALQAIHPELYQYLEQIFNSQPGPDWQSPAPPPVSLPPGFPDPDRDPVYLRPPA